MRLIVGLIFVVTLAGAASAQTYYQPSGNYANPDSTMTDQWRRKGCADPWVAIALNNVFGRVDASKCGTALYNGGQWSDFNQLVHAVARTRAEFDSQGVSTRLVRRNGQIMVAFVKGGQIVAVGGGNLIGHDGATLVGQDGASLIGDGAGTIASATFVPAGQRPVASKMTIRLPVGLIAY